MKGIRYASSTALKGHADNQAALDLAAWRSPGRLPDDVAFFIAAQATMQRVEDYFNFTLENDEGVTEILDLLSQIVVAHGRSSGWPPGQGPVEFQRLTAEYHLFWFNLLADLYRDEGQGALAMLIRSDYGEFYRRSQRGKLAFTALMGHAKGNRHED